MTRQFESLGIVLCTTDNLTPESAFEVLVYIFILLVDKFIYSLNEFL